MMRAAASQLTMNETRRAIGTEEGTGDPLQTLPGSFSIRRGVNQRIINSHPRHNTQSLLLELNINDATFGG